MECYWKKKSIDTVILDDSQKNYVSEKKPITWFHLWNILEIKL